MSQTLPQNDLYMLNEGHIWLVPWLVNAHNIVLMKEITYNFGVLCSGIHIVVLTLALKLVQERKDNRHLHLVHLSLTGQVSVYNHQTPFSGFLSSPEGPCKCKRMKTNV